MSKSESCSLTTRVQEIIEHHLRPEKQLKVIVGVSGGVDSMVLLDLFCRLSIDTVVAHVNYNTRDEDSRKDQKLVTRIAEKYNYPFELYEPADKHEQTQSGNFQEWARHQRYQFFRSLKSQYSADYIVTAHHQDDQIETILMKLLRGAGLASWGGMEVVSGDLLRPLLSIPKKELQNYAEVNEIPYRQDYTNFKPDYARNIIRLEVIDKFDELLPGWAENILSLPETAQQFKSAIQALITQIEHSTQKLYFEELCKLEPTLRRSLILEYLKNSTAKNDLSKAALRQLDSLPDLQTGQKLQLSQSIRLVRDRTFVHVQLKERGEKEGNADKSFIINSDCTERILKLDDATIHVTKEQYKDPDFQTNLYIDAEAVIFPIVIRPWADGDRFQPLGMDGHQLVSDHLTNRKIPSIKRKEVFVAETFDQTICAVIFPPIQNTNGRPGSIAHKYRCTRNTKICLKIKPLQPFISPKK